MPHRLKAPQKLQIPPRSINQLQQMSSTSLSLVSARKRKSTFITQNSKRLNGQQLVLQSHNQLIQYIDTLQFKVQKIIEAHDSQFLLAYKNHLHRVKQQMQQLKNKNAKNANSAQNHTQKIQSLEKELIIFREQALKLFEKLTQKDKNIELLNMRIYELQTQQKFNKKTISDLMKRNKVLEGLAKQFKLSKNQQEHSDLKLNTVNKNSISFYNPNYLKKYSSSQQKRDNSKIKRFSFLVNQYDSEKDSRPTTTGIRSKRNTVYINTTTYDPKQKLNNYFAQHIQKSTQKN